MAVTRNLQQTVHYQLLPDVESLQSWSLVLHFLYRHAEVKKAGTMRRIITRNMQHHYIALPFDLWRAAAQRMGYERRTILACLTSMRQREVAAAFRGWQVCDTRRRRLSSMVLKDSRLYVVSGLAGSRQMNGCNHARAEASSNCACCLHCLILRLQEAATRQAWRRTAVLAAAARLQPSQPPDLRSGTWLQAAAARRAHSRTVASAAVARLRSAAVAAAFLGWREAASARARLHDIAHKVLDCP